MDMLWLQLTQSCDLRIAPCTGAANTVTGVRGVSWEVVGRTGVNVKVFITGRKVR